MISSLDTKRANPIVNPVDHSDNPYLNNMKGISNVLQNTGKNMMTNS